MHSGFWTQGAPTMRQEANLARREHSCSKFRQLLPRHCKTQSRLPASLPRNQRRCGHHQHWYNNSRSVESSSCILRASASDESSLDPEVIDVTEEAEVEDEDSEIIVPEGTTSKVSFLSLTERLNQAQESLKERAESNSQAGPSRPNSSAKRKYPGIKRTVDPADFEDYSEAVDALWSVLPLEELRRPGEIGWDVDPLGPVGAERFENVYNKTQQELNSTAIAQLGMGSWRLRDFVGEIMQCTVAHVEGGWRHFVDDLALYGLKRKWSYLDSLDPEQVYGDSSYKDLESPQTKNDPKYPRLQIENRCYQSEVFRKLHMEVAHRQDGLEIFHCVMFPRIDYDLPILSIDIVAFNGRVSLGIIDPCPVTDDLSLPPAYVQICSELAEIYAVEPNRNIPDWGKRIFSEQCIIMRCDDEEDYTAFSEYMIALVRVHLRLAAATDPIEISRVEKVDEVKRCHQRYCSEQLKNLKTKRVLAAAFSDELADEYMTKVMFDYHGKEKQKERPVDLAGAASQS